jgi:hypothetical protein
MMRATRVRSAPCAIRLQVRQKWRILPDKITRLLPMPLSRAMPAVTSRAESIILAGTLPYAPPLW